MIKQKVWQEFALKHQLGLMGISFASKPDILSNWRGYHIASQGSGQVLVDGIRKIYGADLPILLFGFFSGALFTCQFVDWKPDRVLGWCADAAGWGGDQSWHDHSPPGIIACGEFDADRYGWALTYFKKGRALGKLWLWISLPKTNHAESFPLEEFVRDYFASLLHRPDAPIWVDIDEKHLIDAATAKAVPSLSGWLPDKALFQSWCEIHEP